MLRDIFGIVFLLLPTSVHSQGGTCTFTADCPANSVCIGVPNGLCYCLNPYVTAANGVSCVYSCQVVLSAPTNGDIDTSEGYTDNSVAYYSCNAGYTLNGDATQTCDDVSGGWTGSPPICIETAKCASNTCQNGATCYDLINQYTCTCVAGYEGTNCETDTDECASSPCQNGAKCTDQVNQYMCTCVAGYESTHCEIGTDAESTEGTSLLIIVAVVAALVLVVLFVTVTFVLIIIRIRRKTKTLNTATEHPHNISCPHVSNNPTHLLSRTEVTSDMTNEDVLTWLHVNNFIDCERHFGEYTGKDLLDLSKEDLILICGAVDGIRLYNILRKRHDDTTRTLPDPDDVENGDYNALEETRESGVCYENIEMDEPHQYSSLDNAI